MSFSQGKAIGMPLMLVIIGVMVAAFDFYTATRKRDTP